MDKELKIGAVVCCYNRDQYIGPYLEQLLDHNIEPIVTLSDAPWTHGGNQESLEHDKTEKILNELFPQVKVLKGTFSHHRDSFNRGIEKLQHCDRIIVNDCDYFMTDDVYKRMFEFINNSDHNVFSINFETMIQEYYFDWRYGKPAIPGGVPPIMAITKGVKMENMIEASSDDVIVWNEPQYKVHHFRFAKKNGSGKHLCNEPTANLHDFTPAPQSIVDLLLKWEKIVKEL